MERTREGPGSLFIIQSSGSPFGLPFFGGSPALEKEVLSPPWHSQLTCRDLGARSSPTTILEISQEYNICTIFSDHQTFLPLSQALFVGLHDFCIYPFLPSPSSITLGFQGLVHSPWDPLYFQILSSSPSPMILLFSKCLILPSAMILWISKSLILGLRVPAFTSPLSFISYRFGSGLRTPFFRFHHLLMLQKTRIPQKCQDLHQCDVFCWEA